MTSSIFSSSKNLILHSSVKHREGTYNTSYIDVRTCPFLPSAFASVFWNHSLVLQPSSSLTPVLLFLCSNSSLHPLRNPLPVGICRPGHVPLTMWSHHGMDSGGRPSSLSLWSLKCGLLFFFSCSKRCLPKSVHTYVPMLAPSFTASDTSEKLLYLPRPQLSHLLKGIIIISKGLNETIHVK